MEASKRSSKQVEQSFSQESEERAQPITWPSQREAPQRDSREQNQRVEAPKAEEESMQSIEGAPDQQVTKESFSESGRGYGQSVLNESNRSH